jgi:hypothetical protein
MHSDAGLSNQEREAFMKFMATWDVPQDEWLPLCKRWGSMSSQERANAGTGVKVVGRWHDVAARTGVAIFESDDLGAVQRYMGQWNAHLDIDLVPVLDDEESAARRPS